MKIHDLLEAKDQAALDLVKQLKTAIRPLGVVANPKEKRETPGAYRFWFSFKDKKAHPTQQEVLTCLEKFSDRKLKAVKKHDGGYEIKDENVDFQVELQVYGNENNLYVQVNKNNPAGEDNRHGFDK